MKATFYGVRGSIPVSGQGYAHGGNTSCIGIEGRTPGSRVLVLDAGTGLRDLGNKLALEPQRESHILLSHVHWDHIMGLPFFLPLYSPESTVHFYGPEMRETTLEAQTLGSLMGREGSAHYNFPVSSAVMRADRQFHGLLPDSTIRIPPFSVETFQLAHPDPTLGYRIIEKGGNRGGLAYCTDNEISHLSRIRYGELVQFVRKARVLVADAQYTDEECLRGDGLGKDGWGHSTVSQAARLALHAGVRQLVLYHHDPGRTDEGIGRLVAEAQGIAREKGSALEILAAQEGLVLDV